MKNNFVTENDAKVKEHKVDHFLVKLGLPLVYHLGFPIKGDGEDSGDDDGDNDGEDSVEDDGIDDTNPNQQTPTNTNP